MSETVSQMANHAALVTTIDRRDWLAAKKGVSPMAVRKKLVVVILELVALILALGVGFSTPKAPITVVALADSTDAWVDDDDPMCSGKQPCFSTIQAAVDTLERGTVHIFPGRYRENVVITKNVALTGEGAWEFKGVRELVRLEPRDPLKPTILVKGAGVETISALEIVAGTVGIQIEDSGLRDIANVRVVGGLEAGIRLVRSAVGSILSNEIIGTGSQVTISGIELEDSYARSISMNSIAHVQLGVVIIRQKFYPDQIVVSDNTFNRNLIHIRLEGQVRAWIRFNHLSNGGNAIELEDQAWAYIVSNQISANYMGVLMNDQSQATIELNSFTNNLVGIQSGGSPPYDGLSWSKSEQSPQFEVIRNRISGSAIGLILVNGQGLLLRNEIADNGVSDHRPSGMLTYTKTGGILLSPWMRVEISNNQIENNTQGVVYISDRSDQECSRAPVEGEIKGQDNEIKDNEFGDLCPADYPWPPGFRK
jgi:hypothetical protein